MTYPGNLIRVSHRGPKVQKIKSDFLISPYPVMRCDYLQLVEKKDGGPEAAKHIYRCTWMDAIRYCNLLNRQKDLPPAYDECSGIMLDETGSPIEEEGGPYEYRFPVEKVIGFRLPTAVEWEFAAMSWFQGKGENYQEVMARHFKIYLMDRISLDEYMKGVDEIDKLVVNASGLYGMLGNVHEWYSDDKMTGGVRNKLVFWEEYIVNYDNKISHMVQTRIQKDTDSYGFRVVRTCFD